MLCFLGALPNFMFKNHLSDVISGLIKCSQIDKNSSKYAQSRRDALKALTQICRSLPHGKFYSEKILQKAGMNSNSFVT